MTELATPFALVLRGYERTEVDAHLEGVAATVNALRGEVERVERERRAIEHELERVMAREAQPVGGEPEGAAPSFEAAGRMVAEILRSAHDGAERYRAEVEADLDERRARVEAVVQDRRRRVDEELRGLRSEAEALRDAAADHLAAADRVLGTARDEARATANDAARSAEALLTDARAEADALRGAAQLQAATAVEQARADTEALERASRVGLGELDRQRSALVEQLGILGAGVRLLVERADGGPVIDLIAAERTSASG